MVPAGQVHSSLTSLPRSGLRLVQSVQRESMADRSQAVSSTGLSGGKVV